METKQLNNFMRFSEIYLTEKLYTSSIKEIKNLFSSIINKEMPSEIKTDKGIFLKISSIGGWSTIKEKLTQALVDKKWKDYSEEANSLNFKNKELSLFVEFKSSTLSIFLTDDLNYVPSEEENG